MKPVEILLGVLRLPVDIVMTVLALLLAYELRQSTDLIPGLQLPISLDTFPSYGEYLTLTLVGAALLVVVFAFNQLYSLRRPRPLHQQITRVFGASLIWLFTIIAWYFLIRSFPFSRLTLLQGWALTFLFVSLGRGVLQFLQNRLYASGLGQTVTLLIGSGQHCQVVYGHFNKNRQYRFLGYLHEERGAEMDLMYLGKFDDLEEIHKKYGLEKIIQCQKSLSSERQGRLLEFCREHHIEYSFVPDTLDMQHSNIEIDMPGGMPLITLKPTPLEGWGRVVKRAMDFVGAGVGIILLSPLLLICAVLIKLDDRRAPILFSYLDDGTRVKRVGLKGKLFNFYKFRTMRPNTHNLRYSELSHLNTREGTPMVKIKNDPRVTRIGRVLRKTSLDELPQLFNVLKGEMSLVGPRPHLPEEVARYQKHHKFVLTIKPGITGLAQISGRSDLDFEEEIQLDSYYIENWSPLLDIKILLKTVVVLFRRYEE